MVSQQTGVAAPGGGGVAAPLQTAQGPLVVADFSSWPGSNQLGEYAGAGEFGTDSSSSGTVVDGALRLEYDDAGWFLQNVRQAVGEYAALEIDVRGDDGGEEEGVQLEVGNVEGPLAELADGSIDTELSTLTVDLEAAGVDRSSVQDVWLTFWQAGTGAIEIEELRFVPADGGPTCEESVTVGDRTVCDTNGDGYYEDVNGDGELTHADVQEFFSVQHRPTWKQPEYFDFNGNDVVGHGDVIALFEDVATGKL